MIGLEMREYSDDENPKLSGQHYTDEEIKQYVEDRDILTGPRRSVHLWEFLLELLMDQDYSAMIQWTDELNGEFKLKNSEDVARKWGQRKHKEGMNYDKLSRALRYYYSKDIIKKVSGRRFVYKFVPSSEMQAAVASIKAHMIRNGIKNIPGGPFSHLQNYELPNGIPTPKESKPFIFYPLPREPSSPRYGPGNPVIKICRSPPPVRSRSPHRYDNERREQEEVNKPRQFKLEVPLKARLLDREEERLHPRIEHAHHRRHHSERDYRHHEHELQSYHLTPPTDHLRNLSETKSENHFKHLPNVRHRSTSNYTSYASVFGPLCQEREKAQQYMQKREDLLRQAEKYSKPAEEVKSGFIDLASTRSIPIHKETRRDDAKHFERKDIKCTSPPLLRARDVRLDLNSHPYHHERRHSSSLYETHHRSIGLHETQTAFSIYEQNKLATEPYSYMYRRYAPMIDASTQTQTESYKVEEKQKLWTTRDPSPINDRNVSSYSNRSNSSRRSISPYLNCSIPRRSISPANISAVSPTYNNHLQTSLKDVPNGVGVKTSLKDKPNSVGVIKLERSASVDSTSSLNVKDNLSEGSPDVFSSVDNNSPTSTLNSIIDPMTPTSAQQHCKCGCKDKDPYPTSKINLTSGTVVVYSKEVY